MAYRLFACLPKSLARQCTATLCRSHGRSKTLAWCTDVLRVGGHQEMRGGVAERVHGSNIDLLPQGGRIERKSPSFGRNGRLSEGCGRNMSGQVAADVEGPAEMDSLTEHEFHRLADEVLERMHERIDGCAEDLEVDGYDSEYAQGVLTLKFPSTGTFVMNKQTPNRQIWLSSPVSGPARFDWMPSERRWVYKRTKNELVSQIEDELSSCVGSKIDISSHS